MFLTAAGSAVAAGSLPRFARAAESDISLETATGTIYGTLTLPAGNAPVPIVLIVAGSGPTDRDGNSPGLPGKNDAYKLLAAALAQRGIASIRYDKRGIAASAAAMPSGGEAALRFDDYVSDAAAWLKKIAADRRFTRAVVAGHSEGSLIGMIAAQRAPLSGYVSLEGAGRPAATVLREQLQKNLPAPLFSQSESIIASLQSGKTVPLEAGSPLAPLFRASVQPYLISWFKYDPAAEIAKVRVPAAIVQGTADVQVGMADAQALAHGNPSAKLVVVDGMNHVLKHAPDISSQAAVLKGYTDPALPVEPLVVQTIASLALSPA